MQFVAPVLLVMAMVVTFHGLLRTFLGPRADRFYPEAASIGSTVSFLYIVLYGLPGWPTFLLLTVVGLVTKHLSVKLHRALEAPKRSS